MSEDVLIERRGAVQWITINREARRNAMNAEVIGLISQAPELGIAVMRELASRLSKTTAELGEARRALGGK